MKKNLNKLLAVFMLIFGVEIAVKAQPMLTVPNYTACNCQTITCNATWNNVSSITYTLLSPGGPPQSFSSSSFTLANCTVTSGLVTYTLIGSGTYTSAPITNTVTFVLTIAQPLPLSITNQTYYCNGDPAVFTAGLGGTSYTVKPPTPPNLVAISNVITINNPAPGNYTISTVISGCTVTGITQVSVAPNTQITINTASSVCQGVGCVNLTGNLAGGTNYQWYDNFNSPIPGAVSSSTTLCNLFVSQGGTYKLTADLIYFTQSCPRTATTQINVVATNPVNASASPASILCQGASLNLSANAGGATNFVWAGPQNFASNISSPVINPVIPANTGVYTVTANFISSFLTCTTKNTVTVSIVAMANPVITMSPNICAGTTGIISAACGVTPNSFSWSGPAFNGGSAVGANYTYTNATTNMSGTQFVTANFGNGCVSTSSAQLNVVPVNTISVIPPGQVCSPTNAFLQALATGANLYTWEGPNGFSTPGANVYVYYPTPAASGIYTVTAYFGSGSSLVCKNTETVSLSVFPVLNFSLIPRQEACYNSPITITGPDGATSYTWTSSTGFTSNTKDITFPSAQPKNSGTYTLNINLGPCKSSGSSEIVILDPIQFSLTPQNRTVCQGDTIFLEGAATGGSENYAYVWNPSIYLSSNVGPTQVAVPLGSVQYNLIVHDIACPNYTIAHPFEVNVNLPPVPSMTLAQNEGCAPLCLFYNTGTQNEAFVTTFDFGNNLIFQKDSFNYCLDIPGTYTVMVYSKGKNGCSGVYQYPYPLTVKPNPGSDFTWEPANPTTIDEITFTPKYSTGPVVYRNWTFIGGVTPGDTSSAASPNDSDTTNIENPTRLYEKFDTYPVLLIQSNENECTDSVIKYVKVIDNFQLFIPNTFTPNGDGVNDVFMPKGMGMKQDNYSMEIFNRGGKIVFSTKDINEGWDGKEKGTVVKDAVYIYKIKVVGMNGEGRREYTGYVTVLK